MPPQCRQTNIGTVHFKRSGVATRSCRVTRRAGELSLVAVGHRLNAEKAGRATQLGRHKGRIGADVTPRRRPRDGDRRIAADHRANDLRAIALVEDRFAEAEGDNFRRF